MKSIQTTIEEHCRAIQTIFQNENQYWKDIQSTIDQYIFISYLTRHSSPFFFKELQNQNLIASFYLRLIKLILLNLMK